jgi:hypothetical protein
MGMRAEVEFPAEIAPHALLVPHNAIYKVGKEVGVYVVKAEGPSCPESKFVPCEFGLHNSLLAEVLKGDIVEGDYVYTRLPSRLGDPGSR